MRVILITAAVLIGAVYSGVAQTIANYPYKTVTYVGADGSVLPGPEGAQQRMELTYRDSLSGTIRVYNAEGKVKEITPYADMERLLKYGAKTTYDDNGQMLTKEDFVGNVRHGELLMLYPEGKMKRRETYQQGKRLTGECFSKDGASVPYFEYEVMPSYKGGGLDAMVRAIQHNVRYPQSAWMNSTTGRVFVSFQVSEKGEVVDVKVVKGVSEALDRAALSAVKKLSGFTPGQQDGHNVSVSLTIPVTFSIEGTRYPYYNPEIFFPSPRNYRVQ